jgi:NitT/TauT family transport system permease protein
MMLPAPSDIAANFVDGFSSGLYLQHLQVTLFQALSGFVLACALGICIGSISSFSERFARALQPILIAVEATPKIALAPLIIVAFGYGMGSKIVLATIVAFFPVFLGTVAGLRAAEQGRLDVLRALGASRLQMFRMVALPGALPHIFAGINVAVVFALLAAIVGEFMGSKEGLGTLILYANGNLDTARVFSILLVLAVTGLSLHGLIGALRRRLLFWDGARDETYSTANG